MVYRKVLAFLFIITLLSACSDDSSDKSADNTKAINIAIDLIKSEPRVKDLHLERLAIANQWNIGVIPTKESEYSFAANICDALLDLGLPPKEQIVRIVDITKVINEKVPAKMASLKRLSCEFYNVLPE